MSLHLTDNAAGQQASPPLSLSAPSLHHPIHHERMRFWNPGSSMPLLRRLILVLSSFLPTNQQASLEDEMIPFHDLSWVLIGMYFNCL